MNTKSFAVVILAICPLLVAQQPLAVSAPPQEQLLLPGSAATPAASSHDAAPGVLPDGAAVRLKIGQTISSEEAKTGQEVPFEVLEDVNIAGVGIIRKGDSAFGTVTKAVSKRRMGRAGKLDITINYVRLADQEKVPLRATKESKGHGSVVGMTVGMAATAVLFFPAAPLFLLMHGKDVTVPQGTVITAFVEGEKHLDMAKFGAAPAVAVPVLAPVAPVATALASLAIDSNPPGADIEIDGTFVGSTPSTVSAASGQHQVAVKKKGFVTWSRTLDVSGGVVNLRADLEEVAAR